MRLVRRKKSFQTCVVWSGACVVATGRLYSTGRETAGSKEGFREANFGPRSGNRASGRALHFHDQVRASMAAEGRPDSERQPLLDVAAKAEDAITPLDMSMMGLLSWLRFTEPVSLRS
jgi:hypothetical protein